MLLLNFQQFGCHAREYCVTDGLARRDLVDVLFVVVEVCYVTSNKWQFTNVRKSLACRLGVNFWRFPGLGGKRELRAKCHIYKHSTCSAPESFPPSKRMLEWQSRARMGKRIRHCNWRWLFEVFYFHVKWMIELNCLPTQRLRFGRLLDKTMHIIPTLEKQQDNVISLTSNVSPIPWKFKPDPPLPHNKCLNSEESILVWWLYYNPAELYLSCNPMKVSSLFKDHHIPTVKNTWLFIDQSYILLHFLTKKNMKMKS